MPSCRNFLPRFSPVLLFVLASLGQTSAPATAQVPFANVSAASGLNLGGYKDGGLSWGDFNGDLCLDLVVNTQRAAIQSRLFLQYAPGGVCSGSFDDLTACIVPGLANRDPAGNAPWTERAALWGDPDHDGDLDVVVSNHGIDPGPGSEPASHSIELFLNAGAGAAPGAPCGYDPDNNAVIDPVPWAVFVFGGQVAIGMTSVIESNSIPPDTRRGRLGHLLVQDINTEHVSFNDFDADGDLDIVADNHSRGVIVLQNRWNVAPAQWTPCGLPPCNQTPMVHNTTSGLPFCEDAINDPPTFQCTPNMGDYGASGDFDRDGDVDFVVRKRTGIADYYRNDGVGPAYFANAHAPVDFDDTDNNNRGGVSPCDFDSDGDFDLFWTDDGTSINQIWEQTGSPATPAANGNGAFTATNEPIASTGVTFFANSTTDALCGDWDHDGDLDLFLSIGPHAAPRGDYLFTNQLVENGGHLAVPPVADRLDFNCAMGPHANCTVNTSTCNTGAGHVGCGTGEGSALGDYDNDGDLDLVINQSDDLLVAPTRFEFNELWRNTTSSTGNALDYLKVRALWDIDGVAGGVARDAIGATIQLLDCGGRVVAPIQEVNGGRGHGAQNPLTVHFGLEFGPSYPYFVRVEFVGGTVVQVSVTPSSLGGSQTITVRSTDSSSAVCLTPAVVGSLSGVESGEGLWLELETFAEVGTLGLRVHRVEEGEPDTPSPGTLVGAVLPAQPPTVAGSRYRLLDREATAPYERYRYYVVETSTGGRDTVHGPLAPQVEHALDQSPAPSVERVPRLETATRSGESCTPQESSLGSELPVVTKSATSGRSALAARLKILVKARGLVRLPAADIAGGIGLELAEITSRLGEGTLRLENLGEPVAWRASAGHDALLFLAEESPSPYAAENVYWLELGAGLLMDESPGPAPAALLFADGFESGDLTAWSGSSVGPPAAISTHTTHLVEQRFEENRFAATASATDPEADFWFWAVLSPGHAHLDHATLELPVDAPLAFAEAELSLGLTPAAPGAQAAQLRLLLNGVELALAPALRSGAAPSPRYRVSAGVLQDGVNILELEAIGPAGFDVSYVDHVSLAYERDLRAVSDRLELVAGAPGAHRVDGFSARDISVLEVSDPRRPALVPAEPDSTGTGFGVRFVAGSGARYLVISTAGVAAPDELRLAASAPSVINSAAGAEHLVIAHHSLLAEAERLVSYRISQGLAAVLLDAETIYDQLSFGLTDPRAIRALLELTEPEEGGRFVVLAGHGHHDYHDYLGEGHNLLPPLLFASEGGLVATDERFADYASSRRTLVGRIPARDGCELARYLDKLLAYEAGSGAWTSSVLLLSDFVAGESEFDYGSEVLESTVPAAYLASRVSLRQSGIEEARLELADHLAAGAALVGYTGHGGIDRLSADGLLTSADVLSLQNSDRAPIVAALTCNVARFDLPGWDSLGEALINGENGAVAVLGSVAFSDSHQALDLGRELFVALLEGEHDRLGEALSAARGAFLSAGGDAEMSALYSLLGDPALVLP